jgi:hypothetical protein
MKITKIYTAHDARKAKWIADAKMMSRVEKQGKTLQEAIAQAAAMGPQFGVILRNGKPLIYNSTTLQGL